MSSCSPCILVGWAGCAVLGGLELRINLTILGIGVDRVEHLHPTKRRNGLSKISSLDRVYTWALSQSLLYPKVMLDPRAFWSLEPSLDLESESLGSLRPIAVNGGEN